MKQDQISVDEFLGDATGLRAMALVVAELSELDENDAGPVTLEITARINYRGRAVIYARVDSKNEHFGSGQGETLRETLTDLAGRMNDDPLPGCIPQVLTEIVARLNDGRMPPA